MSSIHRELSKVLRTQLGTKQKNSLPSWSLLSRGRDGQHSEGNRSGRQMVICVKHHGEGGEGA